MALTGFLVNMGSGSSPVCADGSANAILALGARFPYVAGSQPVLCNLESSVFTAPNMFTNTVSCHDLTGGQSWAFAHPLTLMQCDPITWGVSMDTIFNLPASVDLTQAWMIAFTLPLILWLTAWGFGVVVNMFRRDHH